MKQWFEIVECGETKGYVEAANGEAALLEWASAHGPGMYTVFICLNPRILAKLK